ncbi:MAG TPA: hypothetical protein VMZ74_15585 [Ramlibacter sp.]|nr:hypothetical protein [Ramlibacter sp.]
MSRARWVMACAMAASLAGCAMYGGGPIEEGDPGVMRAAAITPSAAQALVRARSTRAEVAATLGAANAVAFDSGYEVWVYRWIAGDRSARAATELVILFGPDGTVRKSRVRAGLPSG